MDLRPFASADAEENLATGAIPVSILGDGNSTLSEETPNAGKVGP